jgi:hypothetical protein
MAEGNLWNDDDIIKNSNDSSYLSLEKSYIVKFRTYS